MAFELTEKLVDDFVQIMKDGLANENVKDFYISEKSLDTIPNYPVVFVLCPRYEVEHWEPDYLDITYTLVIGCIVMEQNTEELKRKIYHLTKAIVTTLMQVSTSSGYTYKQRTPIKANYGPIFTRGNESFIADAQIEIPVQRNESETI